VLELVRGGTEPAPGKTVWALFNLGDRPQRVGASGDAVLFSSEAAQYAGARRETGAIGELMPFECVVFGPDSWTRF
jgi:hypothetical protein